MSLSQVGSVAPACTIFLADIARSKRMSSDDRRTAQDMLRRWLARWNTRFSDALLSEFEIREGDSVRASIADPSILPDVLFDSTEPDPGLGRPIVLRVGIGFGELAVFRQFPDDADGAAYHAAREALAAARSAAGHVVFRGFSADEDRTMTALAALLLDRWRGLTPSQRFTLERLRDGFAQAEISNMLGVTRASIADRLRSAGGHALDAGTSVLATLLSKYDRRDEWQNVPR